LAGQLGGFRAYRDLSRYADYAILPGLNDNFAKFADYHHYRRRIYGTISLEFPGNSRQTGEVAYVAGAAPTGIGRVELLAFLADNVEAAPN
jgi:hypothetical protein